MPTSFDSIHSLRARRDELKTLLAEVGDLRPGSLVKRYRRCGKPNCHCAAEGDPGHGPSWSLTRAVGGKTVTSVIPAQAVEQTRSQIAEYKRFWALAKELVDASERLCKARLSEPGAASQEAAKKGASKKPSRPKSKTKSKRS